MQIGKWRNEAYSNQKTPKKRSRCQISFGFQLQTFPWHCTARKIQPKTQNIDEKNPFQQPRQLYPSIQRSKREAVASFLHLCLNNIWAPRRRHVCISKSSSFFYSSQARNTFQARAGPPTSRCINRLHWYHSKHNNYSIGSRISKDSQQKTLKTD